MSTKIDLSGWGYWSPYVLCRPAFRWRGWRNLWRWFDDQEIDGMLFWNVQRAEPQTRDYPGCPAAVEDCYFVSDDTGEAVDLTDAEDNEAQEWAWEKMAAMDDL